MDPALAGAGRRATRAAADPSVGRTTVEASAFAARSAWRSRWSSGCSSSSWPSSASSCGRTRSGTPASDTTPCSGPGSAAQVGLFVAGLVLALVVLLGNLWLAGRLAPPAEGSGAGGTVRGWLDRLNEAVLESEQRSGRARESLGRRPDGARGPVNVTPYELPNATPIGRVVIAIVAVFVALTVSWRAGVELGDGAALDQPRPIRPGRRRHRRPTPCSAGTSRSSCSTWASCASSR